MSDVIMVRADDVSNQLEPEPIYFMDYGVAFDDYYDYIGYAPGIYGAAITNVSSNNKGFGSFVNVPTIGEPVYINITDAIIQRHFK